MLFSYKTRRVLAGILPTLLTIVVLLIVAALCLLLWLQRFVVYTPQGAVLDFGLQPPTVTGAIPQRPADSHINIEYPDDQPPATQPPVVPDVPTIPEDPDIPDIPDDPILPEDGVLSGYYFNAAEVQDDPDGVLQQLQQLPAGTAVLVQLANFWGYRYYTSEYGTEISEANRKKMDHVLEWLAESDLYVIGRMPAFRDYYYAVDNILCGLKKANGYLWVDPDRCYWLDPTNQKVLTRLTQIIAELKNLGFDEVVFDDFTIPEAEEIAFSGDRRQAIYEAAETLVTACATDGFTVSFITKDYGFKLPEGDCRLYIEGVEPADVESVLQQIKTPDNRLQVVFFCRTFDNRFDGCSVMRPLELA
jgi:hypothetical protein